MKNEENAWLFDLINIMSFYIGVQNLGKNDEQIKALEEHLSNQDKQYERILELLDKEVLYGRRKENSYRRNKVSD